MGNSKSKKVQKEPDKFFDRERWREQKREDLKKKMMSSSNKRMALKEPPMSAAPASAAPPGLGLAPPGAHVRSYDDEAVERMRLQLQNDCDAFLLNNILLSVQFFENYEREIQLVKDNPTSERDHNIEDAMLRHHKHVFFADRIQECVHEHVRIRRRGHIEPLIPPRLFVIYDNMEACEPGDTSDYSAVLDAPFYKLRIEDSKEPGFVKLKKLEVLESTLKKVTESNNNEDVISIESVYTDSDKESNDSDEFPHDMKGEALLNKIRTRLNEPQTEIFKKNNNLKLNEPIDIGGRRRSGPIRQVSAQMAKSNIINMKKNQLDSTPLPEENERKTTKDILCNNYDAMTEITEIEKPQKSILKTPNTRLGYSTGEINSKTQKSNNSRESTESSLTEDTETSGYRSTNSNSSRQNEFSETESEYGYSTITESATPKPVEITMQSSFSASSGVLPDECWSLVQVKAIDNYSDDEDDDETDTNDSKDDTKNLYETHSYLSSNSFMTNFVDNFMMKLGVCLDLSSEAISNALTQGASIYCESSQNELSSCYEVIPALLAAWPNAANQWIIRERRIIQNPRTNFSYQWPTKYMVSKAIGFGCLLVPVGFRPKRGLNPSNALQWKVIFPAAERYLQSSLAHSHFRCYLFALTLHKVFMENEKSKIGIDTTHIKNHLFWQCEDNYAKWPEDRLGESLRLFLKSFYTHFGHAKLPNYFMDTCNDFKSIPKPLLLKLQRKLADILEAPVMHVLYALDKLKYVKKDFYPPLNAQKLYHILTCKNPLRLLNPNLPVNIINNEQSDSDDDRDDRDVQTSFWERAKAQDKNYKWKKEHQRQMQESKARRANIFSKKHKSTGKAEFEMNKNIILPKKMEAERRRLVLEFFIPHFIAIARSSEKFESFKQAIIYLEQAHRLCHLLLDEPAGETSANDYMEVIRDKLSDCQRKLVDQGGFKLPPRRNIGHSREKLQIRKQRPKYPHLINQDSPDTDTGIAAFTFVDVHLENSSNDIVRTDSVKLTHLQEVESEEESKL